MLTRAFEKYRNADGTLPDDFRKALGRRGRLLGHLIWTAIRREMDDDEKADDTLRRLGELAFFMLEHNLIDAVPEKSLQRSLGQETERLVDIDASVFRAVVKRQG